MPDIVYLNVKNMIYENLDCSSFLSNCLDDDSDFPIFCNRH